MLLKNVSLSKVCSEKRPCCYPAQSICTRKMYCLIYMLSIVLFLLNTKGVNCANTRIQDKAICKDPLGVGDPSKITDAQLSASSSKGSSFGAKYGRYRGYNSKKAWCTTDYDEEETWFQVDFRDTKTMTSVVIGANPRDPASHVKTFFLKYSYDDVNWYNYTQDGNTKIFEAPIARRVELKPAPITAKLIRIYPLTFATGLCMTVEFYGCTPQKDCKTPVGMEDRRIANSQITASSYLKNHLPYNARLNNRSAWKAWCADEDDQNIYLQIDLLRKRNISGVATQGYKYKMFTKYFELQYSTDNVTWLSCYNKEKQIKFQGNTNNDTVQDNELDPMVAARYIRFIPKEWMFDKPCMRVEIYECLPVKGSVPKVIGMLTQRVADVDNGGNVELTCTMEGQAGIIIDWYRKYVLVQSNVTQSTILPRYNRVQSVLSLHNVSSDDNGVKYECRGSYPGVQSQYASSTILLRVGVGRPPLDFQGSTADTLEFSVRYRLANITTRYEFEYRAVNTSTWMQQSFLRSVNSVYMIKKLQPWTEYEVKVTPVHRDGEEAGRTSKTEIHRTKQGVPGPPTNVRTTQVNANNATIEWNIPSKDKIQGVIKRFIVKVEDNDGKEIDSKEIVDRKICTIDFLLPNMNYTVRVAIENERSRSAFTNVSFTTGKDIPEPSTTPKPPKKINLEELNQIKIDDGNAIMVAVDVKNLTSNPGHLNSRNVSTTAEILEKIVHTNTKSSKVGDSILATISNVLDVDNDVLEKSNSSTTFVKILEDFVEKGGEFSKNTSNIKIRIFRKLDTRSGVVKLGVDKDSTIIIPEEVLQSAKNKTMYVIYYKNGKLFKRKRLLREICMANGYTEDVYEESTSVMSSGVPGQSVKNLSEKVIIKFNVDESKVFESSSCVYWDFDAAGGAGDWSNKGCTRQKAYNNTIECACDHMTNFAALIDVHAATSKVCGVHADILMVVSYCGCILSIIGLSLTIFTYSFFRRLRKELAAKILIQLCVALLCVLIVFVVGIERSRVGAVGCYIVAVMLHYFVLAAFLWMLVEAHFMYLAFVKVWSQHGEHELLKCSFIAWGLPAIVVGITMAVDLDSYSGGHYCRIDKIAFYSAFFAPVMCVIFVNFIVFAIIMYKLNSRPDSSLGRDRSAIPQRTKQAFGIVILVGVTWLFGAVAISGARLVLQYLFVLLNSIQGFCIFVFYCLSQKNVRNCWKALLTCQLHKLQRDKSFHTNTYDRRRCSTASTTHNNTLSLARKKSSTSSGNLAFPSHSMDTLNREFTSFNCTSGTLPGCKEGKKPNNLNNFVLKDCNVQNGTTSKSEIWKRMSNAIRGDEQTPNSFSSGATLTRSNSSETLCSDDSSGNYHSYDLVASSEGSLMSLHSIAESQASDNQGFYSFINSQENGSLHSDDHSAPNTPGTRPRPAPLTTNNHLTVPTPTKKLQQPPQKQANDHCAIPDDFGKLIVNPSRGSVRGVRGVVETSVDTYDEDSPDAVTPQGKRLTEELDNEQNPNVEDCITSPQYFAQDNRTKCRSKDRHSSTNGAPIGDIYL